MKVSTNWINSITEQYRTSANLIPADINELVEIIGAQLGAVDEVTDTAKKYKGIIVVKVVSSAKHPNADKLSVCLVDDGKAVKGVKRDKDGLVEIVCGAPNVKAGMLAAWIPPGNAVPSSIDKDPFVLEAREIRGVVSNGMLASAQELDIGDDHSGIVEIDKPAQPGDSFSELYRMDDHIIDIENKMFTHRPDCFGMLGIARELAGIQHKSFKSPPWYIENAMAPASRARDDHNLTVKNEVPKVVPRFCALVIKDVKVGSSPLWLRASLSRLGVKPINNIVDMTNFYMLLTAQPLHAYDYDKVKTGMIGVRNSKKGEELKLLGGKTVKLGSGAIVITDGNKPIGLGGVMGGQDTEVDMNTKAIILECASFDMNATRRTAMAYGLFTDAATRFSKNQSPRQNLAVISKAAEEIMKLAGGRVSGKIIDDKHYAAKVINVKLSESFINGRLGLALAAKEIKRILENVEFKVAASGGIITVTVPFWRTDISIAEDVVEEVGRLYGYHKLPVVLPARNLKPAPEDKLLSYKDRLRGVLRSAGANEVLSYSFVHGSLLEKAGQNPSDAYQLANALSPELQYYRLSLTPSLLENINPNIKSGFDDFAIFEIGKGHNRQHSSDGKESVPAEFQMLSLVVTSRQKKIKSSGAPYFQARALLGYLAAENGINLELRDFKKEEPYPVMKPFDHKRSAQVWDADSKMPLGTVGEFKPSVLGNFKLPEFTAGFELSVDGLLAASKPPQYQPLNRFPALEQDICLRAPANLSYQRLSGFLAGELQKQSAGYGYGFAVSPLDIFSKPGDTKHKQTTWRINLWHPDRTLTTREVNKLFDKIAQNAEKELGAKRV
ncbi:MAG TPA: phenylalanine--tRNA ligase subunit beta [Candidatus Saccharimonadales bacterium]|nr:phenylalanine--tRNA ligase subunit beta [Candidatus Saccharimonadales bacterium]